MSRPYGPEPRFDHRVDHGVEHGVERVHADYHRETQQHSEPDGLVDDVVTYRMLAPHLMRTLLFLVVPTVLLLVKVVIDYLASMSSPDDLTDVVSGLLGVLIVVLYLAGVAAFFAPAKEPIAEHARLLEGRADAATVASERVRQAAAIRQSPAQVSPGTVAGVPVLLFRQHSERAMLLIQPYGRDLYVGWTMWRSRSSATLLVHFLRDTFGRFAPSPRFSAELRAASTRALRECVHSLAREGVAAAVHEPSPAPHPSGTWSAPRTGPPTGSFSAPQTGPHAAPPTGPYTGPQPAAPRTGPQPAAPTSEPDRDGGEPERPASALPRTEHAPDPYAPWTGSGTTGTGRRDRVGVPREEADEGWGPPPRDRR